MIYLESVGISSLAAARRNTQRHGKARLMLDTLPESVYQALTKGMTYLWGHSRGSQARGQESASAPPSLLKVSNHPSKQELEVIRNE